jgi:hypothetical protein
MKIHLMNIICPNCFEIRRIWTPDRTASDRGIVAIFDRRVLTKQYGKLFSNRFPNAQHDKLQAAIGLAKMAGDWLGL